MRSFFHRDRPEEEPAPEVTETTVGVTPEITVEVTSELATEEFVPNPNALAVLQAHDPGEGELDTCAICNEPIKPGQNYLRPAYGPVHQEVCSTQTKRV